ncbi:putative ABC transporter permease [Peptostreptococcaceae bacterium OttesenSCG-928-C18]|nr:putative ABC transporter permease [Peptostreptococcaceae bacterium OttesenSCG-928-C18]
MKEFSYLFLLFITYSVIGWVIESIYCSIAEKRLINRGFLIGPYCPIYGAGAILILVILPKFSSNIFAIFFLSMLFSGIVEYITSFVLEKLFKLSLWDYSKNKFNINGRVCLKNLLLFGILAVILVFVINPFIIKIYSYVPHTVSVIVLILTLIIFTFDIILTSMSIFDIKKLSNRTLNLDELAFARNKMTGSIMQDFENTASKIKYSFNEQKRKSIDKLNFIHRRFIKAFPNLKSLDPNESFEILKRKINKYKK